MNVVTPTELRANIYNILEEILRTGVPVEINKGSRRLKIVPVAKVDKFQNLLSRPTVIQGNADDLADIH